MTKYLRRSSRPIVICFGTGLIISSLFNACSKVEFENELELASIDFSCATEDCSDFVPVSQTIIVPEINRKVDIILIVDNSGSMDAEVRELGSRLDGFVGVLDTKAIDWQMAYMFTDDDSRFKTWSNGGKILNPLETDRAGIFNKTIDKIRSLGNSDGDEQGITAARNSLNETSFFREDAALAYVIISDEDQKSCGGTCEGKSNQYRPITDKDQPIYFLAEANSKFQGKPITAHSIIIRPGDLVCHAAQSAQGRGTAAFYGTFYDLFYRTTGGLVGDICASSYAEQLQNVGDTVESSLSSISLTCPPLQGTMSISPNNFQYTIEGNRLVFARPLPAGTVLNLQYRCQKT